MCEINILSSQQLLQLISIGLTPRKSLALIYLYMDGLDISKIDATHDFSEGFDIIIECAVALEFFFFFGFPSFFWEGGELYFSVLF